MKFAKIKPITVENGTGVRVSLFVSGCRNNCPGCFNTCAKDFNYGEVFTDKTISEIIEMLKPDWVEGLTILGGEPFEEENQIGILPLIEKIRDMFPTKSIWCYSGYVLSDLQDKGRKHVDGITDKILSLIDVLVDGPFVMAKKDAALAFRGSSNQRILHRGVDF